MRTRRLISSFSSPRRPASFPPETPRTKRARKQSNTPATSPAVPTTRASREPKQKPNARLRVRSRRVAPTNSRACDCRWVMITVYTYEYDSIHISRVVKTRLVLFLFFETRARTFRHTVGSFGTTRRDSRRSRSVGFVWKQRVTPKGLRSRW